MIDFVHAHWKDILLVIGGIGTVWGVLFPLYVYWYKKKNARPNIKAEINAGANVYNNELSEAMIYVQALNKGSKPINIVSVSILLPKKAQIVLMDNNIGSGLPYELKPEENARYWFPVKSIASALQTRGYSGTKSVKGRLRDAIGREYTTKKYPIKTIEGWLKP